MNWSDAGAYPYEQGTLFLGQSFSNSVIAQAAHGKREARSSDFMDVGIKTERHALTVAGAGAGKGAAVIIPNLLRWPHNALVIDPKGEAAEATAEKREAMGQAVHVLDPFGSARVPERFQACYNPLDDLDPDALTIKEDIDALTDGIVMRPDPQAAHWDDGAQAVIAGLIAYVKTRAPEERRNLIEVRSILGDDDAFAEALEEMKSMTECAGAAKEGYAAVFAKEGQYFVSNARKNTRWLDSRAMVNTLSRSTFSLADLKAGNTSVFLVLPANYLGQHGRFLRLFVRSGIEAMARKLPSGELRGAQCLFLLDEFFSLGYIDEISKAAGLMRGYGLQLWPILQDLGQLITLYGREGSETFFANADVHQFFGNTDTLTLEQISTRLGVKNMSEVPLPPASPSGVPSGFGHGVGALASSSKKGSARVLGAAVGGVISLAENSVHAADQARYQDQMNHYHRAMAEHGRPRLSPDEVSGLIRKKDDAVADAMICFVYGREPLLLALAPYFRESAATETLSNNEQVSEYSPVKDVLWGLVTFWILGFLGGLVVFGVFAPLFGLWSISQASDVMFPAMGMGNGAAMLGFIVAAIWRTWKMRR